MIALAAFAAAATVPSSPSLGMAEGRCRADETGPAFLVTAEGLKDRKGLIRIELYPANDHDFLQDDNVLVSEGKTFRRAERAVPPSGPVEICIRAPRPGVYSLMMLHDRDANHKFGLSTDGVGFPGNPKLGLFKPKSSVARAEAGNGVTRLSIRMNYRHGLFSVGPIQGAGQ